MMFRATVLFANPNGHGAGRERRKRVTVEFEACDATEAAHRAYAEIEDAPKWATRYTVSVAPETKQ